MSGGAETRRTLPSCAHSLRARIRVNVTVVEHAVFVARSSAAARDRDGDANASVCERSLLSLVLAEVEAEGLFNLRGAGAVLRSAETAAASSSDDGPPLCAHVRVQGAQAFDLLSFADRSVRYVAGRRHVLAHARMSALFARSAARAGPRPGPPWAGALFSGWTSHRGPARLPGSPRRTQKWRRCTTVVCRALQLGCVLGASVLVR